MFKVDVNQNRLSKIEERSFSSMNFREREHLQEWLADMPKALGEELLIIQKEFDGFDDTKERLDLLALDKSGQLVVIENKLDDTGKDVVWQSLKYAAYCSSLTKAQVVDVYQQYLDRYCDGGNAAGNILSFLDTEDMSELALNKGSGQRIIMVAAKFRKEVTSTALWLLNHGLRVQCFKATLYSYDATPLLDLKQIIPVPEAAEYMIGISSKEIEETATTGARNKRMEVHLDFWSQTLNKFADENLTLFRNVNPSREHWLGTGSGVRACSYSMTFLRNEIRVEISLNRSSKQENKWIFDQLLNDKDSIELEFGDEFEWMRLENKKACRIVFSKLFNGYEQENWSLMIDWLLEHIQKLEAAFSNPLNQANQDLPDFTQEIETE